jgi:flagellin
METNDGDPCPEEVGMSISINNTSSSLFAQKSLLSTESATQKTLGHLSSGKKINNAGENAANLAIAVQMAAQLGSSNQDVSNAGDALDIANTADAALSNTTDILSRLDELAMESGDGALNASDRADIQNEADALTAQLNSIAGGTEFNGTPLLNGNANLTFQVGTGNVPGNDRLTLNTGDASAAALGVSGLNLSTPSSAASALDSIDSAIQAASSLRSTLGAQANRATSAASQAQQTSLSLAAAHSSIMDADIASEASDLSSEMILGQAGAAVLAQANQNHASALRLLSGH